MTAHLGRESAKVPAREYRPITLKRWPDVTWYRAAATRELVGVNVFVESERDPRAIGITLQAAAEGSAFKLQTVASRGAQVWPDPGGNTLLVDHFRARFLCREPPKGDAVAEITDLQTRIGRQHRWMHLVRLQRFDGADAFSKAQGENLAGVALSVPRATLVQLRRPGHSRAASMRTPRAMAGWGRWLSRPAQLPGSQTSRVCGGGCGT